MKPNRKHEAAKKRHEAARRKLDAARSKHDPDPEKVKAALLGWWDALDDDIDTVADVVRRFKKLDDPMEYRDGFEFLRQFVTELENIRDSLLEGRPAMRGRTTDEVVKELEAMLPD